MSVQGVPAICLGRIEFDLNSQLQNQRHRFAWILLLLFLPTLPLLNPWVRGDGVGYYAYARAPISERRENYRLPIDSHA